MGLAESIFKKVFLKPINFWENLVKTLILTLNDTENRQNPFSQKILNPSIEIPDEVPDLRPTIMIISYVFE